MKSIDDKILEAEVKLKQLKAQRSAIEARKTQAQARSGRASDTRRKILIGAWALERMQRDSVFELMVKNSLRTYLKREDDRTLFGLPPVNPMRDSV
ncbi:hypothetical protein [Ralstonia pickettii]|uniref:hypothetical protein n=1 Tax=Ralstonia pickettii TaxID=329 RepID=UPI00046A6D54|nr:hypothetical protein [Ralstonia pickettii]